MKLLVVSAVFLVALAVLVYVGVVSGSIPNLKLAQLASPKYEGGPVQVDDGKVAAVESYAPLKFTVAAENDPSVVIRVTSPRSVPENFKEGIKVSLRGEYDPKTNSFNAYKISTQCPSRYVATSEVEGEGAASGTYPKQAPQKAGADSLPLSRT